MLFSGIKLKACLLLLHFCYCEEQEKDPTYTFDPDGEIPVVEGFGGNIDIAVEDDVLILTRDNFIHVVSSRELILVEFYAPWCGHCQQLAPEYAKAANELRKDGIELGKVDAVKEEGLAREFLVSGFPTLKLFKNGKPVEEYEGPRNAEGIIDYMKQHADPSYKPPESVVVTLTGSNFTDFVNSKRLVLVEFFALWCRHCKALKPEYEAAARSLQDFGIPLATVNAPEEKELADQYGVKGYPSLIIFRDGRQFEYRGKRDKAGIVEHMKNQLKLPSVQVDSVLQARSNFSRTAANVFAYFPGEGEFYEEYIGAANELRDRLTFLHTRNSEVASRFKLKPYTVTVMMPEVYHSEYESDRFTYSKESGTYKEIAIWVLGSARPLVGQRTSENKDILFTNFPLLVVYYDVNFSLQHLKATQFVRKKILPVANKHKDIIFAISNEEDFLHELKSLGLEDSGEDVNVGIFTAKTKYRMEPDEFSEDVLNDFVMSFKSGKLRPYLKSQPVPKHQESVVTVIVAKSLEDAVLNSDSDTLIEFYAPWCGHCKKLEPIYRKLAQQLATEMPGVVVAKMDATANDVLPPFEVKGFPTIYYYSSKTKKAVSFEGERSLKKLKDFVLEQSSLQEKEAEEDPTLKDEL